MKILVLGGDGYLGWPTAMHLASKGHSICVFDNYLRRNLAKETSSETLIPTPDLFDRAKIFKESSGYDMEVVIGDCADYQALTKTFRGFKPEAVIHYAEQPSAPYSMMGDYEARLTLNNNLNATFNVIWAVKEYASDCHIIKLGTMGEYGTPNIDIEEGWIEIEHKGRKDTFLYPRQSGSLYHTTKILDTDLLWFYVRMSGLRVTDLMQGPVYGLSTDEADMDERLIPNFHYDDIFGTVVNRFLTQAVARFPLTVYGAGGQTRGYLNIKDTLQCVELALLNPADAGELRILNQFTELLSVNDIAEKVKRVGDSMGLKVRVEPIENPRKEKEEHYYNANYKALLDMGLKPNFMTDDVIARMLEKLSEHKDKIDKKKMLPRLKWK
ncbi:UDP-sulfoquinovose synthase [hydrothermal vent metagenome]|uniref:UDP-sulfoquinovose synthase n=1 Tax=hydrothermal vent metagenome TaxID=652676 RepID=A0A3B1CCE2_9ZZZZ